MAAPEPPVAPGGPPADPAPYAPGGPPAGPIAPGGGGAAAPSLEAVVERILMAPEVNGAAGSGISAMSTEGLSEVSKFRIPQALHASIHVLRAAAHMDTASDDDKNRWNSCRQMLMAIAVRHTTRVNGLVVEGADQHTRSFTGWLPRHALESAAVYLVLIMSWEDVNALSFEDPGLTSEIVEAVGNVTARGAVTNLASQARAVITSSKVTFLQTNHHVGVVKQGDPPMGALGKIYQAMPDGLTRGSNTEQMVSTMWRIAHYASTHVVLHSIFPEIGLPPNQHAMDYPPSSSDLTGRARSGPAGNAHSVVANAILVEIAASKFGAFVTVPLSVAKEASRARRIVRIISILRFLM